jgi:hypothetical protein
VPLGGNDPLYDDQTVTLQQAAGNYQVKKGEVSHCNIYLKKITGHGFVLLVRAM